MGKIHRPESVTSNFGKNREPENKLDFSMSEWMTDDEDYRPVGSGDGVEIGNEIETEFNKFIELSWIPVGLAGVTVLIVLVIIGYCCYKRGDSKENRYAQGNQYSA